MHYLGASQIYRYVHIYVLKVNIGLTLSFQFLMCCSVIKEQRFLREIFYKFSVLICALKITKITYNSHNSMHSFYILRNETFMRFYSLLVFQFLMRIWLFSVSHILYVFILYYLAIFFNVHMYILLL